MENNDCRRMLGNATRLVISMSYHQSALLMALRGLMDAYPEGMACDEKASLAFDAAHEAINNVLQEGD